LTVELAKASLPVRVERIQLERIISNLFTNALKYTPAEGTITIKTLSEGGRAIFSINNDAPIIPAEELPYIFDRYKRGASSSGTTGSGLGLHIVKYLLEALKGSVRVRSNKEEGTTFVVSLPLA
jgi:signal transduction histidine kinase